MLASFGGIMLLMAFANAQQPAGFVDQWLDIAAEDGSFRKICTEWFE